MAYTKKVWKDRNVAAPNTFTKTDNANGTITLTPAPGTVTEEGTPVNAENMNHIEAGIKAIDDSLLALLSRITDGICVTKWNTTSNTKMYFTCNRAAHTFALVLGEANNAPFGLVCAPAGVTNIGGNGSGAALSGNDLYVFQASPGAWSSGIIISGSPVTELSYGN